MGKEVRIYKLQDRYYLLSNDNNWREGNAIDLKKNEVIYYNGDYGEKRPIEIKQIIAEHDEIGWVRHLSENSPFISKFDDVLPYVNEIINKHNGKCIIENKLNEKYIIKLPI